RPFPRIAYTTLFRSGHNLGTAPIEDSINQHPAVAESAIVGYPHDIKGSALYGYVILKDVGESRDRENLRKEINQVISDTVGPIRSEEHTSELQSREN